MDNRQNRVFKTERRDIKYPLWRKKVDASIFYDKAILIPRFAETMWGVHKLFKGVFSKLHKRSRVRILFEGKSFDANVTGLNAKTRKRSYRIWLSDQLSELLKDRFVMSFMRDLEFKLGNYTTSASKRLSIEDVIPFNEFLDIEFSRKSKKFIFTAHYTQQPTFNNLFKKILDSTVLKNISNEIEGKPELKIFKSKWYKRRDIKNLPDQPNVLYTLLDEKNEEIYFGEAKSLKKRLSQKRPEIKHWTHFRYNVLPTTLAPFRIEIERMIIRDLASIFPHKKVGIHSMHLSMHKLKNKKIDK